MLRRKTVSDVILDISIYLFMLFLAVIMLFPFLNVVSKSVSSEWAITAGKVNLLPIGFQLDTLKYVVTSSQFLNSFTISISVTIIGTTLSMLCSVLAAYALSNRKLPFRNVLIVMFVFTMMFNPGMIPNYLLMDKLRLINKLSVLVLPALINVYNMLVLKSFFESIPNSLEESAKLDGANDFTVLFKIILPLSTPTLATIGLFYAVAYWNDYLTPMLYLSKPSLKTLQVFLRDVIFEAEASASGISSTDMLVNMTSEGVRAATIVASTLPIVIVYPFLQKYYVKGIMIGSIKG